ncbi:MAG: alpha/beta hydrolase [Pseudomonadota bacterium]|nr:MAG: alpha/beta hydrolase [Pseudomonadota bacterium]
MVNPDEPGIGAGAPANLVTLSDGRILSYAQYGDGGGAPLFYFHGLPGSRLEAQLTRSSAAALGLRVIALDRPGFGYSDFSPRRTLLDWPADVAQVANSLGIERFSVLGVSGGGPYALACAYRLADRLRAVGVVCGLGPLDGPGAVESMAWFPRVTFGMARRAPVAGKLTLVNFVGPLLATSPRRFLSMLRKRLPVPDRAVLSRRRVINVLCASLAEGLRAGSRGAWYDVHLLSHAWGFDVRAIDFPVQLWHGGRDAVVPVAMGHRQAQAMVNCCGRFLPNDGHYSLPINHVREILTQLIG